jgi:redox-sensitive bicupin YhaK (pirin superfamily)
MGESRYVIDWIKPTKVMEGAGVQLRRSIGTSRLDYLDPFLLFDHFGSDDPKDYLPGFPMHPHRGIETVTYMLDGEVNHKDSMGNSGTIKAGDIQWMTAGSGILHEEMPKPIEGKMEGFQLWVNLPAKLKMSKPRYQEIKSSHLPEILTDDGVLIKVIAGEVYGVMGAVKEIYAEPEYLDITVPEGVSFKHQISSDKQAFIYIFRGIGTIGDGMDQMQVSATSLAILSEGDFFKVFAGNEPLRFLVISAKPLREPVARYGPFVMNTTEEIEETLMDLNNGTFVK